MFLKPSHERNNRMNRKNRPQNLNEEILKRRNACREEYWCC